MPTSTAGRASLPTMAAAEDVITKMRLNPGNWGSIMFESVQRTDQFLSLLSKKKIFFNEGQGDTHKFTILSVTRPSESDVGNWSRVSKARPGFNPSQQTYSGTLRYGSREETASLFRHGIRTEWFNKLDLAMTRNREIQIGQVSTIMGNYAKALWELWCRSQFQKAVRCTTLNTTQGWAVDKVGDYAAGVNPDSLITYDWLKAMVPQIRSAPRGFASAAEAAKYTMTNDKQVVFIGYQEYEAMIDLYMQNQASRYGVRPDEAHIRELDLMGHPLGMFIFVLMPEPRRFRAPTGDETWADCVIPPTVPKKIQGGAMEGDMDDPNPDYHNPAVALYSESFLVNLDSIAWLVPPSAMTGTLKGVDGHTFPASNYMGEFFPVSYPCDENRKGENVYYAADFMSSMHGLFPQRSRAILHLAAHQTVTPYTLSGTIPGSVAIDFNYALHSIAVNEDGNLLVLAGGTTPATPADHTLWLETQSGVRYEVASRVSSTAQAGTAFTPAGTILELTLTDGPADITNPSDPWARIVALPTEA